MYKLLASDMDETFLAHDHSIPRANIDAIARLREAGCLFVPASGRGYGSILSSIEPVIPLLEGSYVISYNGGCINRVGEERPLYSCTLDFDLCRRIFELGMERGVCIHVYEEAGTVWGWNVPDAEAQYLAGHMELTEAPSDSIDFLADVPLSKILYCIPDGLDELHQLAAAMPGELLADVDTTFSSGRYLEFCPKGVNKGTGLARLCGMLGVDVSQAIACGDSANDLAMIEAAGMGVAAANATEDVMAAADHICAASCDEGVIAEAAEKFVFCEGAAQ